MKPNLLILGGDQRNRIVLDILRERGFSVEYFSDTRRENTQAILQHISQTEYQLLPMMLAEQPICGLARAELFEACPAHSHVFGGAATQHWIKACQDKGHCLVQLLQNETLAAENAYYTAEGAIGLVQELSKASMYQTKCVVVGSGRIATALCRMLKIHTPYVTVLARNKKRMAELALQQIGCLEIEQQGNAFENAEIVFNTVPDTIIDPGALCKMAKTGIYVELASAPYGCPWERIPDGIHKVLGNGLPGKRFPFSAAKSMAEVMVPYLI